MLNRTGSGQKSVESILGQEGVFTLRCLQCFDPVGWAAGRASGL